MAVGLLPACGEDPAGTDGGDASGGTTNATSTPDPSRGTSGQTGSDADGSGSAAATTEMGTTTEAAESSEGSSGTMLDEPVDDVIARMEPNSWVALPSTEMSQICPLPYNAGDCRAVVGAWSGATYDQGRDRMIVWGGGHADSYYNNVFVFELGPMQWDRLTELPEGADGAEPTAAMMDIRLETCGYYPSVETLTIDPADVVNGYLDPAVCHRADIEAQLDLQQPRSSHTYGKPVYMPNQDAMFYLGGGYFPSAQSTSPWGFSYSFATGLWSESAPRPAGLMGRGQAATDAAGDVWYATDAGGPLVRYRPADDAWDTYGPLNYDLRGVGDIDRVRNDFWILQNDTQDVPLRRIDLDDQALINSDDPYEDIPLTGDSPPGGTKVGFVYADGLDRMVAWVEGPDVYFLDPQTQAWTHFVGSGDAPTVPQTNGTFGRWRYSDTRGVFVLVNHVDEAVYLYKPPTRLGSR